MSGVAHRALELTGQGLDHAKVELLERAGIGAGAVGKQEIVSKQAYRSANLLERGHARGKHDRETGGPCRLQQAAVRQRRGRDLDAGRLELNQKVDRGQIPARGQPMNLLLAAVLVDGSIVLQPKLDSIPVVQIGDVAPGGIPHLVLHFRGHAKLRSSLLKLHRIAATLNGDVNELPREIEVAVVVDPDLGNDVGGMPGAHGPSGQINGLTHSSRSSGWRAQFRRAREWLLSRPVASEPGQPVLSPPGERRRGRRRNPPGACSRGH